jgi:TRAP-type C4-dicarboxylate transport system permease small subunit
MLLYNQLEQPRFCSPFYCWGGLQLLSPKKRTLKSGAVLFVTGAVVLGLIYLAGHIGAEQAMQQRKWTAAALSVGLIPFYSTPVLFVMLFIRVLAGRKRS